MQKVIVTKNDFFWQTKGVWTVKYNISVQILSPDKKYLFENFPSIIQNRKVTASEVKRLCDLYSCEAEYIDNSLPEFEFKEIDYSFGISILQSNVEMFLEKFDSKQLKDHWLAVFNHYFESGHQMVVFYPKTFNAASYSFSKSKNHTIIPFNKVNNINFSHERIN